MVTVAVPVSQSSYWYLQLGEREIPGRGIVLLLAGLKLQSTISEE